MRERWLLFVLWLFLLVVLKTSPAEAIIVSERDFSFFGEINFGEPAPPAIVQFNWDSSGKTDGSFNSRLGQFLGEEISINQTVVHAEATAVHPDVVPFGNLLQNTFSLTYRLQPFLGLPDFTHSQTMYVYCPAETCTGGIVDYVLPPEAIGEPFSGISSTDTVGFSVQPREQTTFQESGSSFLFGTWFYQGSGSVSRGYEPKSAPEYIRDALSEYLGSGLSDSQIAQRASGDIIFLREIDEETSSLNLNLRDAEYFLRGYTGAKVSNPSDPGYIPDLFPSGQVTWETLVQSRNIILNELYDRLGPHGGLAVYNNLKAIKDYLDLNNIGGDGSLPPSPQGGGAANAAGWNHANLSASELYDMMASHGGEFSLGNNPIRLPYSGGILIGTTELLLTTFLVQAISGTIYTFDPPAPSDYAFSVYGNRFAGFSLFNDPEQLRDNVILAFLGYRFLLGDDLSFNFLSYAPEGIDTFVLAGLDLDDPHFGLSFVSAGETLVSIGAAHHVPEPDIALLLCTGVIGLGIFGRKRFQE